MVKKIVICILLSVIIGTIYIYPDIRFISELGDNFKGITLTAMVDEALYLARLNAVYNGNYRVANLGLYEHRDGLWLIPPYFEVLIGLIGKTLKIPLVYFDIILSFIFPVVIFWLIFLLVTKISNSKHLGLLAAASIIMGYNLLSLKLSLIKSIFIPPYYGRGLWFLRPFTPPFSYIPLISSLLAIYHFIDSKSIWRIFIISFLIATLNYIHIHFWAYIYMGLCVWLFISIFRKDKLLIMNILVVLFCSFIFALPFWINYYKVRLSPNYLFLEYLGYTVYTHKPIVPWDHLLLSLLALFLNRNLNTKKFFFLFSFLVGGLLCLNQQIVTGIVMQPVHWASYTNKTFLSLALILGLRRVVPKKIPLLVKHALFYSVILFLFAAGFIQQNNYYNVNKETYQQMQTLSGAFNWLNKNTAKDDVVLTDTLNYPRWEFLRFTMLYTHNYYYLAREEVSLVSEEELGYRLWFAKRFFHYLGEKGSQAIAARRDSISLLKRYKINYLLLRKGDKFFENITDIYPVLEEMYNDGYCKIYKFK